MTARIELHAASPSDLDFLCGVRRAAMDPFLNEAGVFVSDERNRALVLWRFDCVSVIRQGGRPVGYVKLLREPPTWSLAQIALLPAWQGQGIATTLLARFIAQAREAGCAIELSVFRNNVRARQLYERCGFEVTGGDEREDFMRREC